MKPCPTCGEPARRLGRLRRGSAMIEYRCDECGYHWTEYEEVGDER